MNEAVKENALTGLRKYKPYPVYKDSGVEWLGEVPAHWKCLKLKRVTSLAYGDSFNVRADTDGDFNTYGSNGIIGKHHLSNVNVPGIIIGRKGSFGKINYSNEPCFAIDTTFYIDNKITKENIRWLYYCLQILGLDKFSKDSAVPGLSRESVYDKDIPYCDAPEQEHISSFLDCETAKIDAFITKQERLIELLQEKRAALITRAVTKGLDPDAPMKDSGVKSLGKVPEGWTILRSKHVAPIQAGFAYKSDLFEDEGVPLVRMSNLKRGALDLSDSVKIPKEFALDPFSLVEGDLLIGLSGSVGNFAVVRKEDLPCQLNQRVGRFIIDSLVLRGYFTYFIQCKHFSEPIIANSEGTAQLNISPSELGEVRIVFPSSLEEQEEIVAFLDSKTAKIDALIAKQEQLIGLLRERRSALISAAVTGKIDVRPEVSSSCP
jgi:type I restriction enzyme S subunit